MNHELARIVMMASSLCQQSNSQISSSFGFDDLKSHKGYIPWSIIHRYTDNYEDNGKDKQNIIPHVALDVNNSSSFTETRTHIRRLLNLLYIDLSQKIMNFIHENS